MPARPSSSPRRLRPTAFVAAVLVATGLSACGQAHGANDRTSSEPSSTTSTTVEGPTAAVLTAYRSMWSAMGAASHTDNYDSPALVQFATGAALSLLIRGLAADKARGVVAHGTPAIDPTVTSLSPDTSPTSATVSDCLDDSRWLQYTPSGHLADDIPGGRHATSAVVTLSGGQWKVSQLAVQGLGTC